MEILLIRHGLAGKADPEAFPDDDLRPLTPKGVKAFKRAAKGLRRLDLEPARIVTSPAVRTRRTAELFADGIGFDRKRIEDMRELHHAIAPAKALAALARGFRKRPPRCMALVGHEPWLGEFLSLLVAGDTRAGFEFDKGGACLIEAPSLAKGKGRLLWLMTQDQLASLE
jgi:phosphohistidine phosphatase